MSDPSGKLKWTKILTCAMFGCIINIKDRCLQFIYMYSVYKMTFLCINNVSPECTHVELISCIKYGLLELEVEVLCEQK